jgi:hypothetical protein
MLAPYQISGSLPEKDGSVNLAFPNIFKELTDILFVPSASQLQVKSVVVKELPFCFQRNGLQKYNLFRFLQTFLKYFFEYFLLVKNVGVKRAAKVQPFSKPPNFS